MPSNSMPLTFEATPVPPGNRLETALKKLKRDTHVMSHMQPRLSELTKLYQARKSRIDQFVEWYADSSWGAKLTAGAAVFSVSYMIGALIGMTWVLTCLITGLYVTAISIMEEHADMMRQRDTSFADDIKKMEATIAESIHALCLLEEQLNDVFNSLGALHEQRSKDITRLEGEVDAIEAHNLRYASIIEALGKTAQKLEAAQGEVSLTEDEVKALSTEFQTSLQEAKSLCNMLSKVVSVTEPVSASELMAKVNHSDSNASFIKETDVFISSAQQRLSKLRQARNASKAIDKRTSEVSVVSTALYNFS